MKKVAALPEELKQKLKSNKKLAMILAVGMLGILLIAFSSFTSNGDNGKSQSVKENGTVCSAEQLESRLKQFLSGIEGIGRVDVMITYDTDTEKVYAKDTQEESGKNAYGNEIKNKSEHIIVKNNSNESGLEVKQIYPKIRGVAIICEENPNSVTKEQVVDLVSSLFDISSTHISVASNNTQGG